MGTCLNNTDAANKRYVDNQINNIKTQSAIGSWTVLLKLYDSIDIGFDSSKGILFNFSLQSFFKYFSPRF